MSKRASTDVFTKEKRSHVMRAVKGKNTGPEIELRKKLFATGLRYRLNVNTLPGKPDLVFAKHRTVVFVHGCFWHGHSCKRGARAPKQNAAYWKEKITRNKQRDKTNAAELEKLGWRVVTVWECEIKSLDPASLKIAR